MKEFEWEFQYHRVVLRPVGELPGTLPQKPLRLSFDSRDRFSYLLWESLEDVLDREIDELSTFVLHLNAEEASELLLKVVDSANSPLTKYESPDSCDYAKGVMDWLGTLETGKSVGLTVSHCVTDRETFIINLDELEEDDDER
jgi:hypothetical protein